MFYSYNGLWCKWDCLWYEINNLSKSFIIETSRGLRESLRYLEKRWVGWVGWNFSEYLWDDWSGLQTIRARVPWETSQGVVGLVSGHLKGTQRISEGLIKTVWILIWVLGAGECRYSLVIRQDGVGVCVLPCNIGGVKNSKHFLIYKCNKYCLRNFLWWIVKLW